MSERDERPNEAGTPHGRPDDGQRVRAATDETLLDELFPLDTPPATRRPVRAALGQGGAGRRRAPRTPAPLGRVPASLLSGASPADDEKAASDRSAPERPATDEQPLGRSSWHRAVVVGMFAAAGMLARLVLLGVLHARLARLGVRHQPSAAVLALGGVLVALVVIWLARRRVAASVCVVVGVALATIDLAAPIGIALVLVAVTISRRRRPDWP